MDNGSVYLVDLNTSDVDTRYLTTGTAQTVTANKTFTGTITHNGNYASTGTVTGTKLITSTQSYITCYNGNGWASTDTKIRRYSVCTSVGNDITMSSTAANGQVFTVNTAGWYAVHVMDANTAGGVRIGVSVNSNALTTNIDGLSVGANGWVGILAHNATADYKATDGDVLYLSASDVVRPHGDGAASMYSTQFSYFSIRRIH